MSNRVEIMLGFFWFFQMFNFNFLIFVTSDDIWEMGVSMALYGYLLPSLGFYKDFLTSFTVQNSKQKYLQVEQRQLS